MEGNTSSQKRKGVKGNVKHDGKKSDEKWGGLLETEKSGGELMVMGGEVRAATDDNREVNWSRWCQTRCQCHFRCPSEWSHKGW